MHVVHHALIGLATLLWFSIPGFAEACTCFAPDRPAAIEQSDMVFYATVLSAQRSGPWMETGSSPGMSLAEYERRNKSSVVVRVDEVFKGASVGQTMTVDLPGAGSSCSLGFRENETVIFYLTEEKARICSRTMVVTRPRPASLETPGSRVRPFRRRGGWKELKALQRYVRKHKKEK